MSIDNVKKSNRGRPKVDSEALTVRVERTMLDAIDSWIGRQDDPDIGRPEAVRRLLKKVLHEELGDSSHECGGA